MNANHAVVSREEWLAARWLDLAPKGRGEAALPWTMAWVRHHDRYEKGQFLRERGSPSGRMELHNQANVKGDGHG